jgi:hypothetical protein
LEVLEHLPDPRRALQEARRVCAGWLVASVPREPIWRFLNLLRGAYWRRLGNTPGHLQHWSKRSFLGMLGEHWAVKRAAAPIPWVLALCTPIDDRSFAGEESRVHGRPPSVSSLPSS